jgi:hypothetical protein
MLVCFHSRGGGDQLVDIVFAKPENPAPAERHARRRNDNARFIAASWSRRRRGRDKPKMIVPDAEAPD